MHNRIRETVWGYDPRWKRIEYLDEHGGPLGVTRFERRPDEVVRPSKPSAGRTRTINWPAAILALAMAITAFAVVVLAAAR